MEERGKQWEAVMRARLTTFVATDPFDDCNETHSPSAYEDETIVSFAF